MAWTSICADVDHHESLEDPPPPPLSWTGFNKAMREGRPPRFSVSPGKSVRDLILTADPIDLSPTDPLSVVAMLQRTELYREVTGQRAVLMNMDCGECVKVLPQLLGSDLEHKIMPFLGGLHVVFVSRLPPPLPPPVLVLEPWESLVRLSMPPSI